MIAPLPHDRWHELTDIFREQFDAVLPDPSATILAELDEQGKVTKFVVIEFVARIGQIYQTGSKSREMLRWLEEQITPGHSVIAFADEPRFEGLCKKFGMYEIPGKTFRRDF